MMGKEPSRIEWKNLFAAAKRFKQHECWKYMWDSDVFGVKNPETGKIGYCCVMGRNGEHFGLGVYKGSVGLEGLLKVLNDEVHATGLNALHVQHCLMASFEDRKYIDKKDYALIKKLGLSFRGRNAWPQFRDYTPGFHPWYISSDDARFLTIALDQTIQMAERMKEDPDLVYPEDDDFTYLVRVPQKKNDGDFVWKDSWLTPTPVKEKFMVINLEENTELQQCLKEMKQLYKQRDAIWEVGVSYYPQPVQDTKGERPFYPKMMMLADHRSRMILSFAMGEKDQYRDSFIHEFLSFLDRFKMLPKKIMASDEEFLRLFQPMTDKLGIELVQTNNLEAIGDIEHSMNSFF